MALGDLIDPPVFDSDEIYIRRFKDPVTRIRIMPAVGIKRKGGDLVEVFGTEAWPSELEHYHDTIKSFPCVQPHGETCGGCSDPSERVRKRSRQWYFNAIAEDGSVHPYKMGITLKEVLARREANHPDGPVAQPLSTKDYIINRIGADLQTKYDPDVGETYPVDFSSVEPYDIADILRKQAAKAAEYYAVEVPAAMAAEMEEPPHGHIPVLSAPPGRITPKSAATKAVPAAAAEPVSTTQAAVLSVPTPSSNGWGESPSEEQIDAADSAQLKAWLDKMEVEYPSRAPRARLIEMAKEKAAPPF